MKIAVVIPCRNEAPFIQECIDHIDVSDLPENVRLEVVIVDGMSDDGTREIVQDLLKTREDIKLVDNTAQITPFAINLGIKSVPDADFYQRIDARHMVSPNYMKVALDHLLSNNETWCVGGKVINKYVNEQGEVISQVMGTSFGMGLGNFRTLEESGYTDTVTSPMYRKEVFESIGYFDEELIRNQDDDFSFRITQAGGKIFYSNEIELDYYVRSSYVGLSKQFQQYGYWKVFVNRKHQTVTTLRQLVPPLFVAYHFLILFSILLPQFVLPLSTTPILAYWLLNLYFSNQLSQKSKFGWTKYSRAYMIVHYRYGWGYLRGIIDFLILRKGPGKKQTVLSR